MFDGDPVVRKLSTEIERAHSRNAELLSEASELAADLRRAMAENEQLREERWKPGDPRCDCCDNGLEKSWVFCPFCGQENRIALRQSTNRED